MKELIFRQFFDDIKDSENISETLAPMIKQTFDKSIKELISFNFNGLLVITNEENDDPKAIFKFDIDDYPSPVELSLHIMMILNSISTGEIVVPKGTIIGVDLVKRERD